VKTLAQLRAAIVAATERWDAALTAFEAATDETHAERSAELTAAETAHADALKAFDQRTALEAAKASLPAAIEEPAERTAPAGSLRVTETELTYEKPRHRDAPTFFRDMAHAEHHGDTAARERLERHGRQMVDQHNPRVGARALNISDGTGGQFVPPIYLQEEWIGLPRAHRPTADAIGAQPLPAGTDTINIPKVATGTTVAVQTDGGSVSSTDLTDTIVTAAVQTVAGQQDVSMQLVDFSNPGIERVIWDDITRAYDTKIDSLVLNGAVTNAKGLLQVSGTNSRAFTSGSPTVPLFYPKLAGAIADIHTNVFRTPNLVIMHPLRWAWILASLDSQNRPLVVPSGQPGFNAAGLADRVASEALVGSMQALPVIADASVPTTNGAGTNEDVVTVLRTDEVKFWEGESPRVRMLTEVLSGTLQVRFQLYNYYAFMAGRLPKAVTVISGTGLAAPSF
jgi:HK97 family phage major capsid protein